MGRIRRIHHLVMSVCLLCSTAYAADMLSQNNSAKSSDSQAATQARLWNLQGADINSVTDMVSRITGRNFILDPAVEGKITVISSHDIAEQDVYEVYLSILQVLGYSAIENGDVVKVIPAGNAKTQVATLLDTDNPNSDAVVVKIIPVKYIGADKLLGNVRPMLPPTATVSVNLDTNSLVLSGHASKLSNIHEVVKKLDREEESHIDILPLKYALADDVAKLISTLNTNRRGIGDRVSVAADDRSNSVLISGSPHQRTRIQELVKKLDRETTSSMGGNTQIFYLNYLKANDVVPILAGIAKASYGDQVEATLGKNSQKNDSDSSSRPSDRNPTKGGSAVASESYKSVMENNAATKEKKEQAVSESVAVGGKKVEIVAETNTNSIIVSGPTALLNSMKKVVKNLDARPAQVLVEAIIVEIREADVDQYGIQWGTRTKVGSNSDGTDFSSLSGGLGIGFITQGSFRVLLQALGRDTNTNILSTPTLVVLDNQTAQIRVGKKVPFITGSYQTNASDSITNPFSTTKREDVGLFLSVTPQINEGNAVQMDVLQGNETLVEESTISTTATAQNPTTNTNEVKTTVLVNDGEILVLGGLITNEQTQVKEKVPVLGDIPLLGYAFSNRRDVVDRKKLMVFLRPKIIPVDDGGQALTQSRYDYMRDSQLTHPRRLNSDSMLPQIGKKKYVLPEPFKTHRELPHPIDDVIADVHSG